jgi:hypothetical protein
MGCRTLAALGCLAAVLIAGCGGSGGASERTKAPEPEIVEDGIGMTAPIKGRVVARRQGAPHVQRGPHGLAANPCFGVGDKGVAVIGLFSDTPEPKCLRVAPGQRILVVNRSEAFFRHDRTVEHLKLGNYTATIGPQQAALFPAKVGSYLAPGLHEFGGSGRLATPGVMVVRPRCNRHPGSPPPQQFKRLCF